MFLFLALDFEGPIARTFCNIPMQAGAASLFDFLSIHTDVEMVTELVRVVLAANTALRFVLLWFRRRGRRTGCGGPLADPDWFLGCRGRCCGWFHDPG